MTKRDFDLVAKVLKSCLAGREMTGQGEGVEVTAYALSEALLDTNPRFDQVRFLTACGVLT